jgi:hypothetical protein
MNYTVYYILYIVLIINQLINSPPSNTIIHLMCIYSMFRPYPTGLYLEKRKYRQKCKLVEFQTFFS